MIVLNTEGPHRLVEQEMLAELTRQGWKVVAVLEREEIVDRPLPPTDEDLRTSAHYRLQRFEKVVAKQVSFLVRQERDAQLEALHDELNLTNSHKYTAENAANNAIREVEELTGRVEGLKKNVEAASQAERRATTRAYELQNANQKLEGALGKVRKAFGDLKVREVLGE